MPKTISSDIIAVLRKYELADEETPRKLIRDVKQYPERMLSHLIAFTFERTRYYLLFDNNAGDDPVQVKMHIALDAPNLNGTLIKNPTGGRSAYGMPFKGKDVYLFAERSLKQRIDHELTRRYPELSRSTVQKYIKAGYVTVNGDIISQPKFEVRETDELAMTLPEKESFANHELPVIYIDDNVIVVNKPSGVLTHSKGVMNDEFTVAEFFRRYTTSGLETTRPGIVHRLDRDTSGIIIGARNEATALSIKKQFADRKVKKRYVAIVDGVPKTDKAIIDLPIARNPAAPSTFRVDPSGKSAQTTYEVIVSNSKQSLILLQPKTGRTHQLRIHLAYINTPISGDHVYGRTNKEGRLYLHAYSLEVTLPGGHRTTFTAPLPEEFTKHFPGASIDD